MSDIDAEVSYLLARCLLIVDAVEEAEPDSTVVRQLRGVVESTAAKKNVRGMRTIRNDLLEMREALPDEIREELDQRLREQSKTGLFDSAS